MPQKVRAGRRAYGWIVAQQNAERGMMNENRGSRWTWHSSPQESGLACVRASASPAQTSGTGHHGRCCIPQTIAGLTIAHLFCMFYPYAKRG